jgi:Xaa-Pro aminopeptidase
MNKMEIEIAAVRKAAALADEGYAIFRNAARPGRKDYELVAEMESFFRAKGVPENFMIVGVGGQEVRGMAPPGGKILKAGDMVTTELTPCYDGYYAQICRTLIVGEPSEAHDTSASGRPGGCAPWSAPGRHCHETGRARLSPPPWCLR